MRINRATKQQVAGRKERASDPKASLADMASRGGRAGQEAANGQQRQKADLLAALNVLLATAHLLGLDAVADPGALALPREAS